MADVAAAAVSQTDLALTGSSSASLVVDDEGICLDASLGACRLLGLGRSRLVGAPLVSLLEPGSQEPFEHFWRAFAGTGGHAGPFDLAAPATAVAVEITIEDEALPSRHLVTFKPPGLPADGPDSIERPVSAFTARGHALQPTDREREILGLVATGATDPEIAEALRLSPATVQTHVRNAKAKLGARTRAQAVALALRRGLIKSA